MQEDTKSLQTGSKLTLDKPEQEGPIVSPDNNEASPPQKLLCKGKKKDGSPCTLVRAQGYGDYCRAHGMTTEQRMELVRAGVAARQRRAEERSDAVERGRMGLRALMAEALEEHAEEVVGRLLAIVRDGSDADALRAADTLMSRVYGRPVQPTEDVTERSIPSTAEQVRAMSPEERRALLSLVLTPARPLPALPEPAQAES